MSDDFDHEMNAIDDRLNDNSGEPNYDRGYKKFLERKVMILRDIRAYITPKAHQNRIGFDSVWDFLDTINQEIVDVVKN